MCATMPYIKVTLVIKFFFRVHFINDLKVKISVLLFAVDVEHSHVRFLGNLVLNLWDCGG